MNTPLVVLISVLLIVNAVAITRVRGLFALMVMLGVFSGLMATLYSLLGAVDVGFTEAVVGAGVSTLFLMALIRKVDPTKVSPRPTRQKVAAAAVAIGVTGVLLYGVVALPKVGDPTSPVHTHVAETYMTQAYKDMHTPNTVTAVLADYRGLDTMVEATVVVTAALACLLVLRKDDDDAAV